MPTVAVLQFHIWYFTRMEFTFRINLIRLLPYPCILIFYVILLLNMILYERRYFTIFLYDDSKSLPETRFI
jgi:hypothetical protein